MCYNKKRFKSNLSNQQWKYFEITRDSISFSNIIVKNNTTFGEILTLDFNLVGDGEITFDATCNCYERAVADFTPAQLELTTSQWKEVKMIFTYITEYLDASERQILRVDFMRRASIMKCHLAYLNNQHCVYINY